MDALTSQMRALGERIPAQVGQLDSLEATRTALVLPVFQALGYDVFDSAEFLPAPGTGDPSRPASEGPDYAVMLAGAPLFLVECRQVGEPLLPIPATRTGACFPLGAARAAIFTDGVRFQLHTDLLQPGRLDPQPVMTFDLSDFDEQEALLLPWLAKGCFDADAFRRDAADVSRLFPRLLDQAERELAVPSPELVQLLAGRIYRGPQTPAIEESLAALVHKALKQLVRERIRERLLLAMSLDGPPEARVEEVERRFATTQTLPTRPLDALPVPEPFEDAHAAEIQPVAVAGSGRPLTWLLAIALLALAGWGGWRWVHRTRPAPPAPEAAALSLVAVPQAAQGPHDSSSIGLAAPPPAAPETAATGSRPPHVLKILAGDLAGAADLGRQKAAGLDPARWTLRLAIAYEGRTVVGLLESLPGEEDAVFLLPIRMKDGRTCYQVFLGDFEGEAAALARRSTLPAWFLNRGDVPIAYRIGALPDQQ